MSHDVLERLANIEIGPCNNPPFKRHQLKGIQPSHNLRGELRDVFLGVHVQLVSGDHERTDLLRNVPV